MDQIEELEAQLVSSDLGTKMTSALITHLKEEVAEGKAITQSELIKTLKQRLIDILEEPNKRLNGIDIPALKSKFGSGTPIIVMIVGVNGVGKTTTTAKLASKYKADGYKVMLAAADTFRAAAVEQLKTWGDKISVPVISGAPEAKPATVVYDAVVAAKNEGIDILLIDTAGRLHTKSNLMQELFGVRNAISRHIESAPHETILVVDGATGQNALSQAEQFNSAISLSGLIVTKLDGTPKGGIVAAIKDQLGIPIRYIGVGESADDLREFDAKEFVEALLDVGEGEEGGSLALDSKPSAHGEVRRRRREAGAILS